MLQITPPPAPLSSANQLLRLRAITSAGKSLNLDRHRFTTRSSIRIVSEAGDDGGGVTGKRTCKNCKKQFDPLRNHPSACRHHTAHFGGETRRKFESVYSGGTMDTPKSGKVLQYWHCCGLEDPFHPGCTSAPHASYDD